MVHRRYKQFFRTESRCIAFAVVVGLLVECLFVALGWSHFRAIELATNVITSVIIGSVCFAVRQAATPETRETKQHPIEAQ
jgi:glycopeptide antibiotics resistance protein